MSLAWTAEAKGGWPAAYEIRYRLAYDGEWVSAVLAVFLRVVGAGIDVRRRPWDCW